MLAWKLTISAPMSRGKRRERSDYKKMGENKEKKQRKGKKAKKRKKEEKASWILQDEPDGFLDQKNL